MMRASLVSFLWIFIGLSTGIYAQSGNYFMTQYTPTLKSIDNINFEIVQDNQGLINVANRAGLLRFDGRNWVHTSTPASIFSLDYDSASHIIYCGGYNGLGKFQRNDKNEITYVNVADSSNGVGPVYQVIKKENTLIGLGEDMIYRYDLSTKSLPTITPKYSGSMYELFALQNKVFVSTENSGLMLLQDGSLVDPKINNSLGLEVEFAISAQLQNEHIVGTADNELFVLRNGETEKVLIKDEDNYLQQSGFVDAEWVNESILAIATFKGGVIFVDFEKKTIDQIINYQTGLPDNEIFALSKDSNGGLWVAHSDGLTRISPQLPLRNFSYYEGLEGKIESVINHQSKLYVGTSLGLYYLKKVNVFDEVSYLQRQQVKITKGKTEQQPDKTKEKRGLLGLFKKRKNQSQEKSASDSEPSSKTIYTTRTRKQLKSTSYRFVKISDIDSRVTHLASYKNSIYCSSLNGLFKVNGETSTPLSASPTKYFTIAEKSQLLLSTTIQDQIETFSSEAENEAIDIFCDYRDNIQHIFEGNKNELWVTSDDEIFKVSIDKFEIFDTQTYPLENAYFSSTFGSFNNGKPLFINQKGNLVIGENNRLEQGGTNIATRYILGTNDRVWVLRNDQWSRLGSKVEKEKNLLNVFKNLNYISLDQNNNYWVVTQDNQLVKIGKENSTISETYDLYLKHIISNDRILSNDQAKGKKLKFVQSKNALSFQFAQPEFSGILELKYQYKLEGLNKEWSEWSDDYNRLNFNYLPEGSYSLKVRSKDILGKVHEIQPIEFKIVPPYWKRPWFYALEFTLIALILFGSIRLKDLGFRYRLASRLLALVSLIIIIEFIQTVAESKFADESSPVIDFLIQVSIAIIVLPVESLIRKFLFKEKNVQILDFVKLKNDSNK